MVRHIVSWNFIPELDEARRQSVREEIIPALLSLKGKISCLRELQVFCPPLDGSNCDLVLYTEFDDPSDVNVYQEHPDHQAVVPLVRANFCDRRCCDIPD